MWSGEPAGAWKNPACGPPVLSWLYKVVMTSVSQASHEEALTEWLRVRPQIQAAQVKIPAPPLNTWVTLGSVHHRVPQFPHLEAGDTNPKECCEDYVS